MKPDYCKEFLVQLATMQYQSEFDRADRLYTPAGMLLTCILALCAGWYAVFINETPTFPRAILALMNVVVLCLATAFSMRAMLPAKYKRLSAIREWRVALSRNLARNGGSELEEQAIYERFMDGLLENLENATSSNATKNNDRYTQISIAVCLATASGLLLLVPPICTIFGVVWERIHAC